MSSGPSTKTRLALHGFVRAMEIFLFEGHFIAVVIVAAGLLKIAVDQDGTGSSLTFSPPQFGLPLILVLVPLVLLMGSVLVLEFRDAGLPRSPEPTRGVRLVRLGLRIALMANVVMCFVSLVFFATMTIAANLKAVADTNVKANAWPVFLALQSVAVSVLFLACLSMTHLEWLWRLAQPGKSLFATVPAPVQHLLPTQLAANEVKARIRRGANERIVNIWLLGLAVVFVGVSYAHSFFPQIESTTNLIAQFVVGAVAWLWISVSLTIFFRNARARELAIIDGTYTDVGRGSFSTIYFSVVLSAGLALALACLSANLYTVVSIVYRANVERDTFALLVASWAPIIFYAAIHMDVLLIHVRNTAQDQSVCARIPIALSLGMEYGLVADTALAYDEDF